MNALLTEIVSNLNNLHGKLKGVDHQRTPALMRNYLVPILGQMAQMLEIIGNVAMESASTAIRAEAVAERTLGAEIIGSVIEECQTLRAELQTKVHKKERDGVLGAVDEIINHLQEFFPDDEYEGDEGDEDEEKPDGEEADE